MSPQTAPTGTTVGAPGVGELPWFSFEKFPLTKTAIAQVNVANGNLLVKDTDLTLATPGYGFRQARFYNGLSTNAGTLGGGWGYNASTQEIGLDVTSTYADFHGPNGTVVRFTYANKKWVSPVGANMTLTQSGTGDFAFTVTSNRTGEQYAFDGSGRFERTTDRNGAGEYYALSQGQIATVSAWGPSTTHSYLGYDFSQSDGSLTDVADSAGRKVLYGYDSSNRLNKVTAPDGSASTYTYDSTGRLSTITSPSAGTSTGTAKVTFGYDAQNRVTSVTEQQGSLTSGAAADAVTKFSYSSGVTTQTDPKGNTSSYAIDSKGRVTKTTDGRGKSRSQTWTANSDVQSSTDALTAGNVTNYEFDSNNNATKASLPTGAAATASYSVGGSCNVASSGTAYQPKCSTDAAGNKASYQYDTTGNLLQQNDITGSTAKISAKYSYETRNYATSTSGTPVCGGVAGQVCSSTDGKGRVTNNTYDKNGNLTKVTPPSPLGATSYTYDSVGRVTSATDGKGQKTQYVYDVMDRVVKVTYANGGAVTTSYYTNGLTKTVDDSAGGTQSFQYDTSGSITQQTGPNAASAASYGYDAAGNLLSATDASGTINYGYDQANNLTQITDPGGSCPAAASAAPAAGSGCVRLQYDDNEQESARLLPGGAKITTARDNSARPTRITATDNAGAAKFDVGYGYAKSGTDQGLVQTRTSYAEQGIHPGSITTYGYDSKSQLTSASEKSPTNVIVSWEYTYDDAGNRIRQILNGGTGTSTPTGTTTYAYNAANQLTKTSADIYSWSYDANGVQTSNALTGETQAVDPRLAITSTGTGSQNSYFGDGNATRNSSATATFGNTALGVSSITTSGNTTSYTRTPVGNLVDYRTGATSVYYVTDAIGSVTGLFDSSGAWAGGYSYAPFGEARYTATGAAVTANPFRYIGGFAEGDNLYKLGSRYYDANLGRFTQMDPSGQEVNPYVYAGNNPINASDPSGLVTTGAAVAAAAINFAAGAIGTFLCGILPLLGCIGFGALYGAIGGGISGGILAASDGASPAGIQAAFFRGAAFGAIAGALRPFGGKIAAWLKTASGIGK